MESLHARLERLEGTARRQRLGLALATSLVALLLLGAWSTGGGQIQPASAVVLLDDEGRVRAALEMVAPVDGADPVPALVFRDAAGVDVARLIADGSGGVLELRGPLQDGDGGPSAHAIELGVDTDGAWVDLVDGGVPRIKLGSRHGVPSLAMVDSDGRLELGTRIGFLGTRPRQRGLFLEDAAAGLRASLVHEEGGGAGLTVYEQGGIPAGELKAKD